MSKIIIIYICRHGIIATTIFLFLVFRLVYLLSVSSSLLDVAHYPSFAQSIPTVSLFLSVSLLPSWHGIRKSFYYFGIFLSKFFCLSFLYTIARNTCYRFSVMTPKLCLSVWGRIQQIWYEMR